MKVHHPEDPIDSLRRMAVLDIYRRLVTKDEGKLA
jgi:hypothetical protein